MKKVFSLAAVFGLSLCCAAVAEAGGACCKGGAATAAAGQTAGCTDKGGAQAIADKCCASKGGMACTEGAPKLGFRVGDKLVTCPDEARKLMSDNANAKMVYVVAGKDYADQTEAHKAYGAVLTSYMNDMLTVREVAASDAKKCPVSGSTIEQAKPAHFELAGFSYGTRAEADKALVAAKAAADKVTMNYRVAGKSYNCPDEAKKAATADQKVEYVVGESATCCDVMANIDLTRARIAAASKALASTSRVAEASRS